MDESELDDKLERLDAHRQEWAQLELDRKIELLDDFIDRTLETADDQVEEALDHEGIEPGTPAEGEEWLSGPVASLRTARTLKSTLESIDSSGAPPIGDSEIRERPDGQVAVEVFPRELYDRLLFNGFSAEIWLDPDIEREEFDDHVASFYDRDEPEGGLSLVLGAGNVASIPPLDALHKLYAAGRVAIIKLNPVNDYLGPFLEERFRSFIDAGFVEIAYGGADVGAYLTEHDLVDDIHITGSDATHDAIVFGTGEEGEERKEQNDPKLDKPITSELGNISPVIAVPGPWSERDIQFHAENIATQLANNAGFNCNAVRVLVTPEEWDRRDALLDAIESTFEDLDTRDAYYPGAHERFERFIESHDDTSILGDPDDDAELPYAILRNVDPEEADHPAFNDEAWCTVMAETRLPGDDPAEFLRNAVDFCNDVLWGTLNASMIVHPETRRDLGIVVNEAIDDLEYGSVVLNHWPALSYALGVTAWGGAPGSPLDDIQSGRGWVHNTLLLDAPQKSVVEGPFTIQPKPPWFATNEAGHEISEYLANFEGDPSFGNFLGVAWKSVFG